MSNNCELCDKKITYSYSNINGDTVINSFFQVKQNYICVECVKDVVTQTHHKVKKGRKHITTTLEIDWPTYSEGRVINKKCDDES